ncbi:MAG: hypothetical protein C0407_16960, partial [Desulfobacca sp.]|nr:hypothetical protein [Desulfobacca sp.]
ARKTLAECKNNLCDQQQALILIARAQVKANKTPEAIKTLVEARDFVGRYGKDKESAYTDIASFQAQLGDIEGAQKTAALMVDPRSIGQKKVILAPRQPVEKNESPENKKHPAQFFTNLIDTKLNQVVFLNPEVYFQSLAKTLGPRERVEELLRAAEETTENLKALKQPPGQP